MGSQDTPSTMGSTGSVGTSVSIGSPILSTTGGKVKEETDYPEYEFQRIEGMRNLLCNPLLLANERPQISGHSRRTSLAKNYF